MTSDTAIISFMSLLPLVAMLAMVVVFGVMSIKHRVNKRIPLVAESERDQERRRARDAARLLTYEDFLWFGSVGHADICVAWRQLNPPIKLVKKPKPKPKRPNGIHTVVDNTGRPVNDIIVQINSKIGQATTIAQVQDIIANEDGSPRLLDTAYVMEANSRLQYKLQAAVDDLKKLRAKNIELYDQVSKLRNERNDLRRELSELEEDCAADHDYLKTINPRRKEPACPPKRRREK